MGNFHPCPIEVLTSGITLSVLWIFYKNIMSEIVWSMNLLKLLKFFLIIHSENLIFYLELLKKNKILKEFDWQENCTLHPHPYIRGETP